MIHCFSRNEQIYVLTTMKAEDEDWDPVKRQEFIADLSKVVLSLWHVLLNVLWCFTYKYCSFNNYAN